jgi:hypothetical protein
VNESVLRLLVLLRFLCFVAVVYLSLHWIFSRLISKPESKVLWFFSVVTNPLIWPVRAWLMPNVSKSRLLLRALIVYGLLWALMMVVTEMAAGAAR